MITNLKSYLEEHPKARIVLKSFGYIFSENMLKFAVGFFVHAMVARHLGPDHFGKLSYIIKTVSIFFTFSLFGVDEIIIKHLISDQYSQRDILKSVLVLRLLMGLLGLFSLGVFLFVTRPELNAFAALIFLYGINIVLQAFNVFELKFHAEMSFRPLFVANNISYLCSSAMRGVGVLTGKTMTFFLSTYIAGELILKALIQKEVGLSWVSGKILPDFLKSLVRQSFPYFLSSFILILNQRISFFFIEKFHDPIELGNYSVVVTLIDMWLFLPTAVCASAFALIASSFNQDKIEYEKRGQHLIDLINWLAIIFSMMLLLTSDLVVALLYGQKYKFAGTYLKWYAFTTIPVFFNLARVKLMALEGRLIDWLIISVVCCVLNGAGHYLWVREFGVTAAIGVFLLSQLLGNILLLPFLAGARQSVKLFLHSLWAPVRMFRT